MKKTIKLFILTIAVMFLANNNVSAIEMNTSNVPNSTYIIGTHVLTRTPNDSYNGVLTTKIIMLASKTISGEDIDSMVIYYKNPRGNWIDALTGESISVSEKIEVSYQDLSFEGMYGDVYPDGRLNVKDTSILRKYLAGMELEEKYVTAVKLYGDVNLDGLINEVDVTIIDYISVGHQITLPAVDYGKYNITYNLDGGEYPSEDISNIEQIISYQGKAIKLNNPVKEGYVFIGWTGSNGNVPQIDVSTPSYPTANLTYTANWGIYGDVYHDGVLNKKDSILLRRYLEGYDLGVPAEKFALVLGDVNADGLINEEDSSLLRAYLAGWSITLPVIDYNRYTITYNLNGGGYPEDSLGNKEYIIQHSADEIKLINPIKAGYTFIGWTGSNGNVPQINVHTPSQPTANLTYTANWIKNYTIVATPVDQYSPDVSLSIISEEGTPSVARIEYMDGVDLCSGSNMTVSRNDLEGETTFIVVLTDGTEVLATLQ